MINPGIVHDGRDSHHRRDARRHPCGAGRGAARLRPSDPGRPLVRGGGRLPARLRDGLPDARDAGRAPRGASGCSCGASAAASRRPCSRSRKALGARVVVTSSSDEKLERATALGADAVVNHETDDVVAAVKEATGGGAHVVVDDVGEATWRRSLDAARPEGRIVVCGATTGPNPPAALHRVWWKQLSILGSTMGTPRGLRGRLRPDREPAGAAGGRQRLPARRGARRARAARGGRAARQDRPLDPVAAGLREGAPGGTVGASGAGVTGRWRPRG